MRKIVALILAGGLSLGVGGCQLRLDTATPELPKLSQTAAARNHAALVSEAAAQGAAALAPQAGGLSATLNTVAQQAGWSAEILGGSWQPWAGLESVPADAEPGPAPLPQPANVTELLRLLETEFPQTAAAALAATDSNDARALALSAILQRRTAASLQAAQGISAQLPPLAAPSDPRKQVAGELASELAPWLSALDQERYRLEMTAGKLPEAQLAQTEPLIEALVREADWLVSAGVAEARRGYYPLTLQEPEPQAELRSIYRDLTHIHLELVGMIPPGDRATWLAALSTDADLLAGSGQNLRKVLEGAWASPEKPGK